MSEAMTLKWGASTPHERGPIILNADVEHPSQATAFGLHGDLYGFHRSMAKVVNKIPSSHVPDLSHTMPTTPLGPYDTWRDDRITTMDPWGHRVAQDFDHLINNGINVTPTVAVNTSYYRLPEIAQAVAEGRIKEDCNRFIDDAGLSVRNVPDDAVIDHYGIMRVTEIVGEQAWHLPSLAEKLGMTEEQLRQSIYENSDGMIPQLVADENQHQKVFLPPLGGFITHVYGPIERLQNPDTEIVLRPHDSCDDGDVGALRCTCRDYLIYATEEAIAAAQRGGIGIIIRYTSQGRGFGSTPKHLVYGKRDTQPGGDQSERYFDCTNEIMGGEDGRLDFTKIGPMLYLNATHISRLLTQSPHKVKAMMDAGIQVDQCYRLPNHRISSKIAQIEIDAKIGGGYMKADHLSPEELLRNGHK